jgi:hypothetical protein
MPAVFGSRIAGDPQGMPTDGRRDPATMTGLRYRVDRFAQRTPLRPLDGYVLRHPVLNALSYPVIVAIIVFGARAWGASWPIAIAAGVVGTVVTAIQVRANHRRRLRNGTSASYGNPQS